MLKKAKITIDCLDHFVLTVRDMPKTCNFYERALGMRVVSFAKDGERKALMFGTQKFNIHQVNAEDGITPKVERHLMRLLSKSSFIN